MNNTLKSVALTVALGSLLAACSTAPKVEAPAPAPAPVAKPAPAPEPRAVAPVVAPVMDPLDDPKGILAKRSVYFDFDSYVVKPDYNDLNKAHANYLVSHAARSIVIQGNTDSRGGREYNLALGQKRADAERKALTTLGVSNSKIEVVSFGKEKPKAEGQNEAAWAENRRADIVYSSK